MPDASPDRAVPGTPEARPDNQVVVRRQLPSSRLVVELHEGGPLDHLDVRSAVDPAQALLLPLPVPPAIDGISLETRLSRLYALPWALAYGRGVLPAGAVVAFSTGSLRFRRTVRSTPVQLSQGCWVADAEGLFATAAVVVDGVVTTRAALADHWAP
ncbi:MAG: hypothetical protein ACXVFV_10550 [Mycobacteriales bacterium]